MLCCCMKCEVSVVLFRLQPTIQDCCLLARATYCTTASLLPLAPHTTRDDCCCARLTMHVTCKQRPRCTLLLLNMCTRC